MKPGIQFVKRKDGVRLAFAQFGNGPALVAVAPWVTSISYVLEDPFVSRFTENLAKGVSVIFYDKHGCGQSDRDRTDFSLEAELLDLETIINHTGVEDFHLFGTSMAGPVSLMYAYKNPEKLSGLILYGTYGDGGKLAPDDVKSALVSLVKASWGLGSKTLAEIFLPGANTEELQSFAKLSRESASPETAARLLELSYQIDVSEILSKIRTPTLILHREGDKVIPVEHGRRLAAEIPDASMKLLKGNIHPWWYRGSEEIIQEILEFAEVPATGTASVKSPLISTAKQLDEAAQNNFANETEMVEQATIVFSDIVSSTVLVTKLGDAAAREIFLQHDAVIRAQLKKHNGRELQNLGDGFMLSFETASNAIKCTQDIQKRISTDLPAVKVRIGVHTGEVVRREGKHPFGRAVIMASRLLSQAQGGQILASDVTRQIVSGGKFEFEKVGSFTPKGFDEEMDMYEIVWDQ